MKRLWRYGISVIGLMALALPLLAQSGRVTTLTGTVVDAETGQPLEGAHAFIATSLMGTATNRDGRFHLDQVPLGAHRLYVSMLGYKPASHDTLLTDTTDYTFDIRLQPTVFEVGNVTVNAKRDRRWPKRLKKFQRLFLGQSPQTDQVYLRNAEVLDFKAKWWGRFEAHAQEPLEIDNFALGYKVHYFLHEFSMEGTTIRYDGEPLFEEMEAQTAHQHAMWDSLRVKAYHGSFRHFMRAALANQIEEEGFVIYARPSLDGRRGQGFRFPITVDQFLFDVPASQEKRLDFNGYIEIIYTREKEDKAYRLWQNKWPPHAVEDQHSLIKLSNGPTLVDHMGEVVDPFGVTLYGYFAFERVSEELPKEYTPPPLP